MKQTTILRWAAGATVSLPDELEADIASLLDLVDAHNLTGRFTQRIGGNDIPWVTPELAAGVKSLHTDTKQQVARNIAAYRELKRQLSIESRIILIKGVSTYILSGREETMRAGDIDLLSNNTHDVVRTLLAMGYIQTRAPFMHEVGEYTKGAAEFDIHEHFPVYSYSGALMESDLTPQHNAGIWRQSHQFPHSKITFDDLEQHAYCGEQTDQCRVLVPDPNLLTIIICAHAFMNYTNMWSISHREKPCVRLGEIADLFELAAHPLFNKERFLAYADHYQARHAIEWASSIALSLFGKNPLPIPVILGFEDALPAARFPRCLWWNFWASLSSDSDDLLRPGWFSMDWLMRQLGANRCFTREGQVTKYSTVDTDNVLPLTRYITQLPKPIPVSLQFEKSESGVVIHLCVGIISRADIERVRVDLGSIASEWIYTASDDRYVNVGFPISVSYTRSSTSYELVIELLWETLGLHNSNTQSVALLIGVGRQTNPGGLVTSILIPLMLEF